MVRLCLVGLLILGCGSDAGLSGDGPDDSTSAAGAAIAEAGSAGQTGAAAGNMATASQGGSMGPMGGAGGAPLGGGAGEAPVAGQGGSVGGNSGGAAGGSGGNADSGSGDNGSSPGGAAGAGGKASDLDPKPVPGCLGYVAVVIPHATCVWFHGDFTFQNKECNVADPTPRACAIASAPGMETTTIVSSGAPIERFEFTDAGCPKACN